MDNKRPQVSHPPLSHAETPTISVSVCRMCIEREWNSCQSFAVIGLEHVPKYIYETRGSLIAGFGSDAATIKDFYHSDTECH